MPRNGDGSSDNGPIEGHAIVHGSSGSEELQHTKKVAPMPEIEKGEAVEGMNASGGGYSLPKAETDSSQAKTAEQGSK